MYRFVFSISLLLSAGLLFVIQPMVAKILLPVHGGTPAVWTVCMLFFQMLILLSYTYVWLLSRFRQPWLWRFIHVTLCLLSILMLPLVFLPESGSGIPEYLILKNLLLQLGLPLLVIGSSAPLLQYAYSQGRGQDASDPYFLYAFSNLGSLVALLSYPVLIEQISGVKQQFFIWNCVYGFYLIVLFWALLAGKDKKTIFLTKPSTSLTFYRCMTWLGLSFIPCSLMMGVTFYISTDVAATPLFWVLPFALYLLSFTLTFARKPIIPHAWVVRYALFFLALPYLGFIFSANQFSAWQMIVVHLMSFFMLALLCHGELLRIRPDVSQLTTFYFCLALGGVLAGVFNGLVAPRLFTRAYDYPLIISLAVFCIPIRKQSHEWIMPLIMGVLLSISYIFSAENVVHALNSWHVFEIIPIILLIFRPASSRSAFITLALLLLFIFSPWFKPAQILYQQRNFYGIKHVLSQSGAHVLMSQSTVHGFQVYEDAHPTDGAQAYYASVLPVVKALQAVHQPLRALIVGLGTGIMACQFHAEDKLSMVEIDQQVIDIASNPRLFTFLQDCPPKTRLIRDDGLLAISRESNASLDLLVIDAFNSDAIPVHLVTLEAFMLYQKKITQQGVILVNISNRHVRLLPVLTAAGRNLDMIVLDKQQLGNHQLGQLASEWVLLTNNEALVDHLLFKEGWRFVADFEARLWTNDYSNLLPVLKW